MCRPPAALLPGLSNPLLDKLDPTSDPPDTSPSRARVETSVMVSALAHAARPHHPAREPAAYPQYLDKPERIGPSGAGAAFTGQKRHRSSEAHHEAGHGGTTQEAPHQMRHPMRSVKQEVGTSSSTPALPQEAGGSSSTYMNVAEASTVPVPWAPVLLLDAKAETKTERSGTSTYSSSPSLTQEPFTSQLESDSGRNIVSDVSRPPPASEGTTLPSFHPGHSNWHFLFQT